MNYSKKFRALFVLFLSFTFISVCPVVAQSVDNSNPEITENTVLSVDPEENILIDSSSNFNSDSVRVSAWPLVRAILALVFIVFLLWLLYRYLKKKKSPVSDDNPFLRRVIDLSIGQGKTVQIVTLLDHAYILGVTDNNVNLIEKIEDKELVNALNVYADKNSETEKPKNFAELLDIFMPKKESASSQNQKKSSSSESIFDSALASKIKSLKNKHLKNGEE